MARKTYKPEEIVAKLRQVDVLVTQGRPVAEAVRSISVTPFTYYRWRKEFGGLKSDQVKRLKDLEKENEPAWRSGLTRPTRQRRGHERVLFAKPPAMIWAGARSSAWPGGPL